MLRAYGLGFRAEGLGFRAGRSGLGFRDAGRSLDSGSISPFRVLVAVWPQKFAQRSQSSTEPTITGVLYM